MKNILITGAGSFVGSSVQRHLEQFPNKYKVKSVSTKNGEWIELDFSSFYTVYHVAGLAHSDIGKVTDEIKAEYYAVNT